MRKDKAKMIKKPNKEKPAWIGPLDDPENQTKVEEAIKKQEQEV